MFALKSPTKWYRNQSVTSIKSMNELVHWASDLLTLLHVVCFCNKCPIRITENIPCWSHQQASCSDLLGLLAALEAPVGRPLALWQRRRPRRRRRGVRGRTRRHVLLGALKDRLKIYFTRLKHFLEAQTFRKTWAGLHDPASEAQRPS